MKIIEKVGQFIKLQSLAQTNDSILIACSGGKDSMCLCHILHALGYKIALAYVDHNTRSGASFSDGKFVEAYAKSKKLDFFTASFDSSQIKHSAFHHEARKFRYNFFKKIAKDHNFSKIATAHHKNDVVESVLINLSRKTGITGLSGIPIKRDNIIRPLHAIALNEIENFVASENIQHIHDESNDSNDYIRNKLRNVIIPELIKWQTNFIENTYQSALHVSEARSFLDRSIHKWTKDRIHQKGDQIHVDMRKIKDIKDINFVLYESLKRYGFNKAQTLEILGESPTGKIWKSETYILLKNREELIIKPHEKESLKSQYRYPFNEIIEGLGKILIQTDHDNESLVNIPELYLNPNLTIRKWQPGDYMKFDYGKKKLKKLFVDNKIDRFTKENVWVLAYENEVLWISKIAKTPLYSESKYGLFLK